MKEHILFLNMFALFKPQEPLGQLLLDAELVSADIDQSARRITAYIRAENYIPQRYLDMAAMEIRNIYGLNRMEIIATHPAHQLSKVEPDELMQMFVSVNSMARGSLAGAKWSWEGNCLTINLVANGVDVLEECLPAVTNQLKEKFDVAVTVQINPGQSLAGKDLFASLEKMRSSILSELPKGTFVEKEAAPVSQNPDTIFGKPFKGKTIPMNEISLDMGFVVVEGKVFNVEHKELAKRNAWVINFDITDNTSSVRVSRFLENKEAKPIL